jgi:transcription elongation factor Elf1
MICRGRPKKLLTPLSFYLFQQYRCMTCGKYMKSRSSLKCHEQRHLGIFRCHCQICGQGFSGPDGLNCHLVKTHGQTDRGYQCPLCEKVSATKNHLQKHMLMRHREEFAAAEGGGGGGGAGAGRLLHMTDC